MFYITRFPGGLLLNPFLSLNFTNKPTILGYKLGGMIYFWKIETKWIRFFLLEEEVLKTKCALGKRVLRLPHLSFHFFFSFFLKKNFSCICWLSLVNSAHQWVLCTVHGTHEPHFSVTFSLKIGSTILFTHLKVILLLYFQFSIFSYIKTDSKNHSFNYIYLSSLLAKYC